MRLFRAMLCMVTVSLASAACGRSATTAPPSTRTTPPVPTAAHGRDPGPSGWVSVALDTGQISVPVDWVRATADCPFGAAPGMIIVRDDTSLTGCVLETGPPIADVVSITPDSALLRPSGKRTSINGITVYWGDLTSDSIRYQVPSLGVQIDATGVLGREVLATLTRPKPQ